MLEQYYIEKLHATQFIIIHNYLDNQEMVNEGFKEE